MQSWPLPKDPQDSAKYRFDWSQRLAVGETIATSVVTVESGTVVVSEQAIAGGFTTFRVAGGAHGEVATIQNRITTSEGNQWDQSGKLRIRSQ